MQAHQYVALFFTPQYSSLALKTELLIPWFLSTLPTTMVFKSLRSINHIPFSQHAVEELLPCSSDENWDGEIQLKGSVAGCLLWEAYYLGFFSVY